jgi:hypothetical protein
MKLFPLSSNKTLKTARVTRVLILESRKKPNLFSYYSTIKGHEDMSTWPLLFVSFSPLFFPCSALATELLEYSY